MGYDLLIVCILAIFAEYFIMKKKYVLFSAYFIFHISFLYIYIMPLLVYGAKDTLNYLNRLDYADVENLCNQIRFFYYIFTPCSFFFIYKLSKKNRIIGFKMPNLTRNFVFLSIIILTLVTIIIDLMKVNFSISLFVDMQLHPRNYTYLREGLGPLTYVVNFSKMFVLFVSVIYFLQQKSFVSLIVFCYGSIFNLLGGSKTSLFVVIIFFVIFLQKIRNIKINIRVVLLSLAALLLVAIISFTIMSGKMQIASTKDAINFIVEYAQEGYFSARVIKDFNWSFHNIFIEIRSLVLTPVPRAIFSDKSLYGFYQECWRDLYQEGAVIYQSSTYGFLSEGHMLFGKMSPLISAIGINAFLYWISNLYNKSSNIFSLFIVGYLFTRVYFFTRSGYLEATNIWALVLFVVFAAVFVLLIDGRIRRLSYGKSSFTCS